MESTLSLRVVLLVYTLLQCLRVLVAQIIVRAVDWNSIILLFDSQLNPSSIFFLMLYVCMVTFNLFNN